MQTIKFRAWNKGLKEMIKSYTLEEWTIFKAKEGQSNLGFNYDEGELGDLEIMQFTGLTDKNGKDIYEGDIIRCKAGVEFYRQCVYDKIDGQYALFNNDSELQFPLGVVNSSHEESEIVGNIYENKDLLTK